MRKTLSLVIAAALITFAAVEVVAAPVKTIAVNKFYYAAPVSGIHIAIPDGMKGFSAQLLPQ